MCGSYFIARRLTIAHPKRGLRTNRGAGGTLRSWLYPASLIGFLPGAEVNDQLSFLPSSFAVSCLVLPPDVHYVSR